MSDDKDVSSAKLSSAKAVRSGAYPGASKFNCAAASRAVKGGSGAICKGTLVGFAKKRDGGIEPRVVGAVILKLDDWTSGFLVPQPAAVRFSMKLAEGRVPGDEVIPKSPKDAELSSSSVLRIILRYREPLAVYRLGFFVV